MSQATHGDYGGYSSAAGTRRLRVWRQGQKVQVRQNFYLFFPKLKNRNFRFPTCESGPKVESASFFLSFFLFNVNTRTRDPFDNNYIVDLSKTLLLSKQETKYKATAF